MQRYLQKRGKFEEKIKDEEAPDSKEQSKEAALHSEENCYICLLDIKSQPYGSLGYLSVNNLFTRHNMAALREDSAFATKHKRAILGTKTCGDVGFFSCGHLVHRQCFLKYRESRLRQLQVTHGFFCSVCKSFANIFIQHPADNKLKTSPQLPR